MTVREKAARLVGRAWFEPLVGGLIVLSLVVLVPLVCLPAGHPALPWLDGLESLLTVLMAVELLVRFVGTRKKKRFWGEYWLDLLCLLPLLRAGRLVRLMRVYRLKSAAARSSWLQRLMLKRSTEYVFLVLLLGLVVLTGMLGLTRYEQPHSGYEPLREFFWISLFTVAESEYAQQIPASFGGRVTLLFLELSGLTFFAMLTATASAILVEKVREGTVMQHMLLEDLEDHVLICGWNSGLESTIKQLQRHPDFTERMFVVIADRKELPDLVDLPSRTRVKFVREDFTRVDVLRKCRVDSAAVALIVSDINHGRTRQDADARTVLAALTIEKMNPAVYTCCELSNAQNESHLRMGKVNEVVITQDLAGHLLAQAALSPSSWRTLHELVQPSDPRQGFSSYEIPEPQQAMRFDELVPIWLKERGVLLVGVFRNGKTHLNPRSYRVLPNDRLVGIVDAADEDARQL